MLFRRRGLGFGRRSFGIHFGRRSSSGFGMYNRRGGRKRGIIPGVILAILIILLVLIFSVRIKDVEVSGNKQYTKEQIESLLFDGKWSRNSAFCYYQNRFQEHKSIPFIEEYKINFKSPTKVEVVVFEKSVVGCVSYMSSYMYFDKDGIIVESSSEQLPGVPVIAGLEFGHIVLHQPLPVADQDIFGEILNLTQVLNVSDIQVDKINYNSYNEAELVMGDITVELGNSDSLDGKIAELHDIMTELTGLSGTLYLDTYDETNSSPTYRFVKKN